MSQTSSSSDSATPIGWTHSNAYRHQCLVRWVIRMRIADRAAALRWIEGYKKLHPGDPLEQDVRQQWKLGNRGEKDDWRADPGR